ncbi:hypothetical protein TVAG_267970 [Trichomonas vaginalis G3]|uniref:DUF3447 domain-containing protein n=1 Tax=Trichomonas vaginalis (strain ATCC PRA-98 / G3) TaxID=412133 RepID=A2DLE6_TRIV3|nr:protein ubiquitination [Trichomonas vaginalis G3]EAY18764.1 hypothetical protein TVAG_267970 [Trichomonas vaginalis G3]KAI5539300.1 protein ubiquitination [Trichomonas vaginalis G3]|eukprot:XP_001579750.1 hypothetical protein [Trichomonas vaginalis G3]
MTFEINEFPLTLLEISAKYGANECFNFLIANGASFNATLTKYAIEGGSFSIIHFCEQQNLAFDFDCYRIAIQSHKNNIADWLLTHYQCAVVQIPDCVHYRNTLAALFSYQNGCDIQFKSTALNETCFTEAAKCENLALAKYFRSKGAVIDINLGREPGESPLIRACRKNNYELIQFLLDLGADVNFVAGEMKYIQYNAIAYACNTNNYEMAKYFIERHADVNSITIDTQGMRTMFAGSSVRFFKTPLWITCMHGYYDIVKLLVEHGANILILY